MKLYYSPGACSLAPHIVSKEAGIALELEKTDLKQKTTASGEDFLKVNGKGYVPVLKLDSGEVLTEGPAITQYLADQKPESGLAPKNGTMERYRLQEWLNFITSEMHKGLGSMFNPAMPADFKQANIDKVKTRLKWLDGQLTGKDYLMGKQFTVADAYLFTVLRWTAVFKIDLGEFPAVRDYFERVKARPKVHEALLAEGLTKH